ncbi:MAG: tetratricopeptide repeat protein, partial [Gemmataceae bacterium]
VGFFNLGLALEQAARLDDSLAALHKARALDPGLHGVQLFTGIVAYKLNRLPDARAALVRATHGEPDNASAWMWLGVTELAQNQPDAAAAALDHAARLDPKNADILYHRGRAHLLVSKESYDAMYALDPNSWRVHEVLAQSDAEALRTEDAIQEFQAAIRVAPTEPGLHEQLGDAFWTGGKLQQADAAYSAELAIDPHNALVKYKLGSLRVTNNQAERGIPLLKQALSGDPTLVDAHYYLGKGFDEAGQQAAAVEQFRLAIAGNGSEDLHIMSWYRLASLYRQTHQPQKAAHALAMFRQMRQARNQRQDAKFQARKNRDQLPEQEKIPGSAAQ